MTVPKQKILIYVTRATLTNHELLVFKHRDFPEAGIQVPAGTVEATEDVAEAAIRELREESGVLIETAPRLLGSFPYFRKDIQQHQLRNVFHLESDNTLPDKWSHEVSGQGDDAKMVFLYYWIDLQMALKDLAGQQGDYILHLRG